MRASCPQCKQPVAITHIIVANYRAYIMDRMARTAFICFATMRPRPSGQLAAQSRLPFLCDPTRPVYLAFP